MTRDQRIIYTSEREKRLHAIQHRYAIKKWCFIIAILGIVGGVYYVLHIPDWQIQHVSVIGASSVSKASIQEAIEQELNGRHFLIFPKGSYFLASGDRIAQILQRQHPIIRTATIKKIFPHTLTAYVIERTLWAIFCGDNETDTLRKEHDISMMSTTSLGTTEETINIETERVLSQLRILHTISKNQEEDLFCVYVDDDGMAYDRAPESQGKLVLKVFGNKKRAVVGSTIFRKEEMARLVSFQHAFAKIPQFDAMMFVFSKTDSREIHIVTTDGIMLLTHIDDDAERIAHVVDELLQQKIGRRRNDLQYIDLRFGNKIFYKFR